MAIKTLRVFQEFTSAGYVPMPVAGNIDYGVTIAGTFPGTTPTTFQTDDPDIDVTLTATTDYYVWIRSHGTAWNPMYTRNVRVYPDSPLVNNVVMGIIIANLSNTVPYTGATANVDLGTYGLKADYLQLNTSPTSIPTVAGTMSWDDADGTANLILKGGNVTLQVGQEQVTRIVNKTGANLLEANYQAVRISGAQGNRLKVALAQANINANSAETLGLVTETINNNQEGFITTSGLIRNINTTGTLQGETWADGDMLYLSGTTAGRITNIKPQAPTHSVIMGYVVRAHQTQGQIYVKVDDGYELDELHNVKITTVANKNILVYETATSLWKNRNIFGTQGYIPYYDDTLLMKDSIIYTNGTNIGIGSTTLTEKLVVNGNVLATQFKKVGGLSTEFLKADGSSDATAYQPLSADLTAIDNLALTTGLLRKNGTDTWVLDQTEYLTLANAISTYQRIDNLQSNLTASATKYPSVNAVNTGLALKLNLSGGTLSGGLTLSYSYPNIALSDVSSGTTWNITNDGGAFKLNYGATNKFYIFSNGNAEFINNLTASSLIKSGGTSTQFLKADGSVDSTTYQPYDADLSAIGALALTTGLLRKNGANTWELDQTEYVALSTLIANYQTIANLSSNLTASSTKYPSVNAVNTGLNLKLNLSGGTLSGDLAISKSIPTLQLSDTSSGTIWNIQNDGGGFEINSGIANKFTILSSGNATFVNDLTANKFIKSGGTSAQFLMADGSVSNGNAGTVTSVALSAPTGFSVSGSPITTSGTLALGFTAGYSLPSDATQATWTAKQNALNGTGFVKIVGTTISYDNSTYYLASNPSAYISGITSLMVTNALGYTPYNATNPSGYISGNQTITLSGDVSGSGATAITTTLATITQGATGSFVKVTLDTKGRVTGNVAVGSSDITSALGYTPYNSTNPSGYISGITSLMVTNALGYTPYNSTNPAGYTTNTGTVTSVAMSVPTGLSISGSPIITSGTLALSLSAGYSIPTTSSQGTWDTAYNRSLTSIGVSGTTTKTLTLTKQDGTTLTASWSDINTDAVTSVFGRTGAIVATSGDYTTAQVTESGNLYYLDSRARASISGGTGISYNSTTGVITNTITQYTDALARASISGGTGISYNSTSGVITNTITQYTDALARASLSFVAGSGAYNSTTGVITIPTNTSQLTNGAGYITGITSLMVTNALGYTPVTNARQLTINGTTYDLSADRSWTISGTIGGLTSGYIPKATSASTLGNSIMSESGTAITVAGSITTSGGFKFTGATWTNQASVGGIDYAGGVRFYSLGANSTTKSGFEWHTNSSDGSIDVTAMRLDSAGNLGLGTSSPNVKLDVIGAISSQSDSAYYRIRRAAGTDVGYITDSGTWGSSGTDFSIGASSANLRFYTNNDVSEKMRLTSGGNLLVGTTTDSGEKLQVLGNTMVQGEVRIRRSGTQYGTIYTSSSLDLFVESVNNAAIYYNSSASLHFWRNNGINVMNLNSAGNLGLGVTPSDWNTAYKAFQLGNGSIMSRATASDIYVLGNAYFDAGGFKYYNTGYAATMYNLDNGSHVWRNAPSGTAGNAISFTQAMTLASSGNLLIGTTTDNGSKLQVQGGARFNYSDNYGYFGIGYVSAADYGFYNYNYGRTDLRFTQSTGAATFSSSVNINGSSPLEALNVNGNIYLSGTANRYVRIQSATNYYYNLQSFNDDFRIVEAGTTPRLVITYPNGNVGIGTTSPGYKLEIYDAAGASMVVGAATGKGYFYADDAGATVGTLSAIPLRFATSATERMRITSGGQILMGTTTAQSGARLQVAGGFLDVWSSANTLLRIRHDGTRGIIETFTGGAYGATSIAPDGGNVLIGTTTDSGYKLSVNGTGRFTSDVAIGVTTALRRLHVLSGAGIAQFQSNTTSGTIYFGDTSSSVIDNQGIGSRGNSIAISAGGLDRLTITSTGAATFSSSVTSTAFFESSDKTIKTLLVDNYQTKGIESITAKLYTKHGKEELGYFAQDVQGILPSAVTMGTNGLLNLSYREILVAKVQRTETEIDKLKSRVLELETQLNLR